MAASELVIWSMALGAVAAVLLARVVSFVIRPSMSQVLGVSYHGLVLGLVLALSGLLAALAGPLSADAVRVTQVLAGPIATGLSNYWIRRWLNAPQRDRLMATALSASGIALPLVGTACLALPAAQQLPATTAVTLAGCTITLWVTVRGWLMGDRLAPVMVAGCLFTVPAVAGMYATAMALPAMGTAMQALAAFCTVAANGVVGFVLWRRDRQHWRANRAGTEPLQLDPVTQLHSGIALVRKLIHAQRRRRRTRREGAVIAVLVFDVQRLTAQAGTAGVNEMFVAMAGRIQRQVGVVNAVGRYYDNCFVTLVETIHSPAGLRTLGLRVSSSARRPVEVRGRDGQPLLLRPDIGVGVVHLDRGPAAVEDILHEAQRMAQAARKMRSRAAILDRATGEVVPVEQAQLGPLRSGHRDRVPHAVPPPARAFGHLRAAPPRVAAD